MLHHAIAGFAPEVASGPWTPDDNPVERWLDFLDASTVTLSGSQATLVDDKSGNGRDLTGTSGELPVYSSGNGSILLSNNKQMTMTAFSEAVDVFAVATRTNVSTYSVIGGTNTYIPIVHPTATSTNIVRVNGVDTDNDTFIDGVQVTGRTGLASAMGSSKFTISVLDIQVLAPATLTLGRNPANPDYSLFGELHELIFIPAGTVPRTAVEAYFQEKWAL